MSLRASDAGSLRASEPVMSWPAGAYDESGVDLTQIAAMLQLSPEERLETLRTFAAGLLALADAARRP